MTARQDRQTTPLSNQSPQAPTVMRQRLKNEHGPVTRRKILAAAASGVAGVILGERLLAPLRAEAQTRGLLPWLSGDGGRTYSPETGGGSGGAAATGSVVDVSKMQLP